MHMDASIYVYICAPEGAQEYHCRWLEIAMWALGIQLRNSGKAASAPNHGAISPAPICSS